MVWVELTKKDQSKVLVNMTNALVLTPHTDGTLIQFIEPSAQVKVVETPDNIANRMKVGGVKVV